MNAERWLCKDRFVFETNYGGQSVDICATCGALVLEEFRTLHEESHPDERSEP